MDLSYQSIEQSIFQELKEAVILIDKHGKIVCYNQQAKVVAQSQHNRELSMHAHILDVFPKSELMRVLQTKKAEIRKLFRLNDKLSVHVSRFPLLDNAGELLGAAAIIQQDGASAETNWQIDEYIQEGMQTVLQNTSQAFVILNEHGFTILQNPAHEKFLLTLQKDSAAEAVWKQKLEEVCKKTLQTRRMVEEKIRGESIEGSVKCLPNLIDGVLKGCILFIDHNLEQAELRKKLEQSRRIIRALETQSRFKDFTINSARMKMAVQQGKIAADMDYPVFLRGAAGTGKKMLANAIHNDGKRKYQAFTVVDCLKDEEKLADYLGRMSSKDISIHPQGTVYFKNITALPLTQQMKLHQIVLNSQENAAVYRLIVSSDVNVETAMLEGAFQKELYYDLLQTSIHIPALKERKEDIAPLVEEWIQIGNEEYGSCITSIDPAAMEVLQNFPYNNNFKELRASLEHSLAKLDRGTTTLSVSHLAFFANATNNQEESNPETGDKPLSELVEEYEKVIIKKTMAELDGNKTLTAKKLGLSVRNLYYKLEKYQLN